MANETTTIHGEKLWVEQSADSNDYRVVVADGGFGTTITFCATMQEAEEEMAKFAAAPRYARYFANANRDDRVRVMAYMPGETVWRNMFSHHNFSGVYSTLDAAYRG